eukprot:TRINITY_DN20850_c0_g1_i1.p1 TRINITY_DN20850_c0_g1~~TRINITY_DN20850_c0_g1_i1.p1  ORF type:complete len:528 (+),score=230.40 TRINITY_DN20850_c0_g1_i1:141-1724(+)
MSDTEDKAVAEGEVVPEPVEEDAAAESGGEEAAAADGAGEGGASEESKAGEEGPTKEAEGPATTAGEIKEEMELAKKAEAAKKPRKLYREDFEWGEVVGEGAYGEVQLATVKETGITYAVKILNKKHIIAQKKVPWVNREKMLLDKLRHPNIVDLFYTFSDPERLHFVLEYCPHGELFDELKKHKALSLPSARFCTAECVSALRFMHETHGVAHRDIKPENILIGRGNHLKIVDFGTAKDLGDRLARSSSFVGTAEYVAPELLRDKEAGLAADLWSLGCMVYQLVCGRPPFRAVNDYLTFQQVINREIKWPDNMDETAKDLIDKLLCMDSEERLGNRVPGGYQELMEHPFFEGIKWDSLPEEIPPPFGPPDEMPVWPVEEEAATSADATPPTPKEDTPEEKEAKEREEKAKDRAAKKEQQASSPWAPFLGSDEIILHSSLISKKKGLFAHKRQLILTDGPRLIYVDPEKMVVKGEIPWTPDLKVEYKSDKVFLVTVPGRVYKLDECQNEAKKWVEAIEQCLERNNGK